MIDVCHIITDSNLGGAGRWVQTLCRYLPRNRFRVTVIFPRGSRLEEILKGERVCLCPAPITADSSFCKKDLAVYSRLLAQLRPAVVHTHGCATARLAAKLKGIPTVFTKHTVGEPMTGMKKRLNSLLCTRAIAVSRYAQESLERDGIPSQKIRMIYNACPDRGKSPDTEAAKEGLQIPKGKLVVGMFARLSEEKGWQAMCQAICLAKEKRLPLFFLLAGGGPLEPALRQQLEGCPVRFLGELTDIGPALHACDAVCVPSLEESFGLTALEAMTASLPVVATRVGGLGEVLGQADELTVKPGDGESLLKAFENLQDDPLRRKLGARGRKRYEELFSPSGFAQRVAALYEEIINHKKKGGAKE